MCPAPRSASPLLLPPNRVRRRKRISRGNESVSCGLRLEFRNCVTLPRAIDDPPSVVDRVPSFKRQNSLAAFPVCWSVSCDRSVLHDILLFEFNSGTQLLMPMCSRFTVCASCTASEGLNGNLGDDCGLRSGNLDHLILNQTFGPTDPFRHRGHTN